MITALFSLKPALPATTSGSNTTVRHCNYSSATYVLQIADDSTVEDLVEILRMKYGLDRDKCRVLRMNGHGYWNIQTSVLNPADEDIYMQRTLRQNLQLRNGCKV
ncbi:hypothetical protein AC1031_009248 [Aphanomyces cochlioides]|nr:hypothetical protein AC1031_009248 [Aphanomyces cochlioides]